MKRVSGWLVICSVAMNLVFFAYSVSLEAKLREDNKREVIQDVLGPDEEDDYTRGFHAATELFYNDLEFYKEQCLRK
jgi:hypothetical protein